MPQLQSALKTLFWPKRGDVPAINRFFVPLIITGGGLFGSVLSFIIIGGMVLSIPLCFRGLAKIPENREIRKIALCLALFFAAELLSSAVNFNGWPTLLQIAKDLSFLGFLPLYAGIAASRAAIRDGIEDSAITNSFAVCLLAVMQFYLYGGRALGGAGNQGVFGVMCLLLIAADFIAVLRHQRRKRALAGLAFLAAVCALILSGMRSLWPGLVLIPAVVLLVYGRSSRFKPSKKFLSTAFVMLVAVGIALYGPAHDRVAAGLQDFRQLEEKNYATSLGQRVVFWQAGWQLAREKPFLGQGPAQAKSLLGERTRAISGTPIYASHYHNALLTYWVRSGLFGVLALIAMFVVPIIYACRNLKDETSIYGFALLLSLELSYMISGMFGIALGHDIMDTVFIGTLAVTLYLIFQGEKPIPA